MTQPQLETRSPEALNGAADARARGIAAIRFDICRPSRRARGLPSKCIVYKTMVFISILLKGLRARALERRELVRRRRDGREVLRGKVAVVGQLEGVAP